MLENPYTYKIDGNWIDVFKHGAQFAQLYAHHEHGTMKLLNMARVRYRSYDMRSPMETPRGFEPPTEVGIFRQIYRGNTIAGTVKSMADEFVARMPLLYDRDDRWCEDCEIHLWNKKCEMCWHVGKQCMDELDEARTKSDIAYAAKQNMIKTSWERKIK